MTWSLVQPSLWWLALPAIHRFCHWVACWHINWVICTHFFLFFSFLAPQLGFNLLFIKLYSFGNVLLHTLVVSRAWRLLVSYTNTCSGTLVYLFLPQNLLKKKKKTPQVWHEGLIWDWEDGRAYYSYIIIFQIYPMTTESRGVTVNTLDTCTCLVLRLWEHLGSRKKNHCIQEIIYNVLLFVKPSLPSRWPSHHKLQCRKVQQQLSCVPF